MKNTKKAMRIRQTHQCRYKEKDETNYWFHLFCATGSRTLCRDSTLNESLKAGARYLW